MLKSSRPLIEDQTLKELWEAVGDERTCREATESLDWYEDQKAGDRAYRAAEILTLTGHWRETGWHGIKVAPYERQGRGVSDMEMPSKLPAGR